MVESKHEKAFHQSVVKHVWKKSEFHRQTTTRKAMITTGAYGVAAGAGTVASVLHPRSPIHGNKMIGAYGGASMLYGAGMLYGAHKKFPKKK